MNVDISLAFLERSQRQVDQSHGKILHCFEQLKDEDVWWTPRDGCNSIGIIVQHLMGNLRQWALSGIGGEPDTRHRSREFLAERRTPKNELLTALANLFDQVEAVYSKVPPSEILEPRRIQGFDTTVLDAIYTTMCHLELHTGQILYLTRLRLGEVYEESWVPASKEQGA